jgi:hypothetical protein
MSWSPKINEWAQWTSGQLQGLDELPTPRYWLREVPWFDDFLRMLGEDGPPQDLHDAFSVAVNGPNGFAVRFLGMDLYHRLAHQDSYPYQDELIDEARQRALDEYRWLVTCVEPIRVPVSAAMSIGSSGCARLCECGRGQIGCLTG